MFVERPAYTAATVKEKGLRPREDGEGTKCDTGLFIPEQWHSVSLAEEARCPALAAVIL